MNKVERINQILRHAKQLRNDQEAIRVELRKLASEMVTLHGLTPGSADAETMRLAVAYGKDYEVVMWSIMGRKK